MADAQSDSTRVSLLLRVRGNDAAAWREFFELYTPIVYSYALRRGLQTNDAEDIAQDVLIEVTRCIKTFQYQPELGRFRDWLGTVTWRRLARFWKTQQRAPQQLLSEPVSSEIPDPQWIDEFQSAVLTHALEAVKPKFSDVSWQIFHAVWTKGEPPLQVATRLGLPIELVYHAKSRILKHLELEVLRIANDCDWFRAGCE